MAAGLAAVKHDSGIGVEGARSQGGRTTASRQGAEFFNLAVELVSSEMR